MIDQIITDFIETGVQDQLILVQDKRYMTNLLLELMGKKEYDASSAPSDPLENRLSLLDKLVEYTVNEEVIEDLQAEREVLSAKIMNLLTPRPSEVNRRFWELYEEDPKKATDDFYALSTANDYVKTRDIARNIEFIHETEYGPLEITINLSKPEKDPKQIAKAREMQSTSYPECALCMENEGYAGHINHAARTNHRIVRMSLNNETWGFQYSPYAYYNEHAIFLSDEHRPMNVNQTALKNLLDIITVFPHYFVGSNAGLPIVGGSILTHDHYQGGRYEFPMAKMEMEREFSLDAYPNVTAGIVKWPMSVIRLRSADKEELAEAAGYLMDSWDQYTDEEAMILAFTEDGVPHNAITPIARRRGEAYELDMVLRNNLTTNEFPDGLYHPHPDVQHIKKENIGLIEVMGLAILPPRLKEELKEVESYLLNKPSNVADYHLPWAKKLKEQNESVTEDTVNSVIEHGVGEVFLRVLEDAGVYKRTQAGKEAFWRFVDYLKNNQPKR